MDKQSEQIKGGKQVPGVEEILLPGERGPRRKTSLMADGTLDVSDSVLVRLESLSEGKRIPLPEFVSPLAVRYASAPPSTRTGVPVMNDAALEDSHTTSAATSSG
jgi:hypothetical protein